MEPRALHLLPKFRAWIGWVGDVVNAAMPRATLSSVHSGPCCSGPSSAATYGNIAATYKKGKLLRPRCSAPEQRCSGPEHCCIGSRAAGREHLSGGGGRAGPDRAPARAARNGARGQTGQSSRGTRARTRTSSESHKKSESRHARAQRAHVTRERRERREQL